MDGAWSSFAMSTEQACGHARLPMSEKLMDITFESVDSRN